MKLDPQTAVASLLAAIPSAAVVFDRFGIQLDQDEKKSLQAVCAEHEVSLRDFLQAMDEIDWDPEKPVV